MSIENGGPWPPINPPQQVRPSLHYQEPQPTLSGPALSDHNNPNTAHRYTLVMPRNGLQEGVKTALLVVCLFFMLVLSVDLILAHVLIIKAALAAQDLAHQLGQ